MPIEILIMADSQDPASNDGFTGAKVREELSSEFAGSIGDGVYDAVIKAGWVDNGGSKAGWSLVLPGGVPISNPPVPPLVVKPTLDAGIAIVAIEGKEFHFYDPSRFIPNLTLDITWIQMGETIEESFSALEGDITLTGWEKRGARWQDNNGHWHIDWEAPVDGFEWNGTQFGGDKNVFAATNAVGFFAFIWALEDANSDVTSARGSGPAGGGRLVRSTQAHGWMEVGMKVDSYSPHLAVFDVYTSKDIQTHRFDINHGFVQGSMVVIACQFQFWLFPLDNPFTLGGGETLLVSFPKLNEDDGPSYAAVVAGKNSFRRQLEWASGLAQSTAAVDGGFGPILKNGGYPGVAPGVYPIKYRHPVVTAGEQPMVTTAYLGAPFGNDPDDPDDQARIVGYLWDTLVVQETFPIDRRVLIGQKFYQCVGNESTYRASAASLWVSYEDI